MVPGLQLGAKVCHAALLLYLIWTLPAADSGHFVQAALAEASMGLAQYNSGLIMSSALI